MNTMLNCTVNYEWVARVSEIIVQSCELINRVSIIDLIKKTPSGMSPMCESQFITTQLGRHAQDLGVINTSLWI